jgi:hypothetical protein
MYPRAVAPLCRFLIHLLRSVSLDTISPGSKEYKKAGTSARPQCFISLSLLEPFGIQIG